MLNRSYARGRKLLKAKRHFSLAVGLPDIIGYLTLCNLPGPPHMKRAIEGMLIPCSSRHHGKTSTYRIRSVSSHSGKRFRRAIQWLRPTADTAITSSGHRFAGRKNGPKLFYPACTAGITTASYPEVALTMAINIQKRDSILLV